MDFSLLERHGLKEKAKVLIKTEATIESEKNIVANVRKIN
ncbi:DUF969 domain-containing protein [Jeotgalibacillus malaysiensis]